MNMYLKIFRKQRTAIFVSNYIDVFVWLNNSKRLRILS